MRDGLAPFPVPAAESNRMSRIFLALALFVAASALAQPNAGAPVTGPEPTATPAPPAGRSDLWQLLTPEQRDQLWRSLSPEQRSDLWRGLQPQERREIRERNGPREGRGASNPWVPRRPFDAADGASDKTMSPEERQQMREQIREAHRMRRERAEAERAQRAQ
jgi:hypothetical protein